MGFIANMYFRKGGFFYELNLWRSTTEKEDVVNSYKN